MAESIEKQIKKSILNYKHGKIFFPTNFSKFQETHKFIELVTY